MSLQEIENAIGHLTPEELAALKSKIAEREAEDSAFDSRIAADATAGKLDGLIASALEEEKAGRIHPL